jgi:DNA-binding transcriptional MerR regulator
MRSEQEATIRSWVEWKLRWLDIPISVEAIAAVIALKEKASPPLSEEEKQRFKQQLSRFREEKREEVLAEMAKLQGNANGSAGTIASG